MKLDLVQKNEIDGVKNAFYENLTRNNVKKYWFDILVEEKETISFGFDAIEIFKIQQYMVTYHISRKKNSSKEDEHTDAFIDFSKFLNENIINLQNLIFKNVPHQDVQENWVNSNQAFNFYKDLNEFEILSFLQEKVYEITQDAYLFYLNKAKKKETTSLQKAEN
jgi:hypothetical protein